MPEESIGEQVAALEGKVPKVGTGDASVMDGDVIEHMRKTRVPKELGGGTQMEHFGEKTDMSEKPVTTKIFRKGIQQVMGVLHSHGRATGDFNAQVNKRVWEYHSADPLHRVTMSARLKRDLARASDPVKRREIPIPRVAKSDKG